MLTIIPSDSLVVVEEVVIIISLTDKQSVWIFTSLISCVILRLHSVSQNFGKIFKGMLFT